MSKPPFASCLSSCPEFCNIEKLDKDSGEVIWRTIVPGPCNGKNIHQNNAGYSALYFIKPTSDNGFYVMGDNGLCKIDEVGNVLAWAELTSDFTFSFSGCFLDVIDDLCLVCQPHVLKAYSFDNSNDTFSIVWEFDIGNATPEIRILGNQIYLVDQSLTATWAEFGIVAAGNAPGATKYCILDSSGNKTQDFLPTLVGEGLNRGGFFEVDSTGMYVGQGAYFAFEGQVPGDFNTYSADDPIFTVVKLKDGKIFGKYGASTATQLVPSFSNIPYYPPYGPTDPQPYNGVGPLLFPTFDNNTFVCGTTANRNDWHDSSVGTYDGQFCYISGNGQDFFNPIPIGPQPQLNGMTFNYGEIFSPGFCLDSGFEGRVISASISNVYIDATLDPARAHFFGYATGVYSVSFSYVIPGSAPTPHFYYSVQLGDVTAAEVATAIANNMNPPSYPTISDMVITGSGDCVIAGQGGRLNGEYHNVWYIDSSGNLKWSNPSTFEQSNSPGYSDWRFARNNQGGGANKSGVAVGADGHVVVIGATFTIQQAEIGKGVADGHSLCNFKTKGKVIATFTEVGNSTDMFHTT